MSIEQDHPPLLRRILHPILGSVFYGLNRLKVEGLENLPADGPLLVAANHCHNVDGPLIAVAGAPRRWIFGLAKIEIYRVPILGRFAGDLGTLPIDRKGDVQTMRAALDHVRNGGCLGIFPEGTRTKTGEPGRAKPGLGFFAAQTQAPVVPCRIYNTFHYPWKPLRVVFGKPIPPPPAAASRTDLLRYSQMVLDRVFSL